MVKGSKWTSPFMVMDFTCWLLNSLPPELMLLNCNCRIMQRQSHDIFLSIETTGYVLHLFARQIFSETPTTPPTCRTTFVQNLRHIGFHHPKRYRCALSYFLASTLLNLIIPYRRVTILTICFLEADILGILIRLTRASLLLRNPDSVVTIFAGHIF